MSESTACLVIFCKRPALFQGKQRLAATIGAEQAYAFATTFLNCALEDAMNWPGPVVVAPASAKDTQWAGGLLGRDYQILAQPQGCLGTRLQTIDQKLRHMGQSRIIFIGTDAPGLTTAHFEAARHGLMDSDVVLSPAVDGGVTIMGSRVGWPDMTDLPWSTDRLGAALENLCCDGGQRVKNIIPSYDIDIEADLVKLDQDLKGDSRPARQNLHRQLREFFNREGAQYG